MGAPVITIFVRHSADCKHAKRGEFFKGCQCRKHFRWTQDGKQVRQKAGTRTWAEAEDKKAELLAQLTGKPVDAPAPVRTIDDAVQTFLQAKALEGVTANRIQTYRAQLKKFTGYAASAGAFTLAAVTPEMLTAYMATWETGGGSNVLYRAMLSSFFGYCYHAGWIPRKPKLPRVAVDAVETSPLTPGEYDRLLNVGMPARLRAIVQLMRHSGLAVRDAATLERSEIQDAGTFYRVVTSRQKTGTHVSVPIPRAIGDEILAVSGEKFLFFHGNGDGARFAKFCGERIAGAFNAAGLTDGQHMKSHRLRDTFACDLLQKGIPLEEVSKLLGHESIRTTEKHYAKWVKGRQDRLDSLVTATWAA